MAKIAVIVYSTYGHIVNLAKSEIEGLKSVSGVEVDLFQVPETLDEATLKMIGAPEKSDIPIIDVNDLAKYDGFLFGFPTRFGTFPAQFKTFWDSTGGLWASGALHGKFFGVFVSTGTAGGGQETTIRNSLSMFIHHGLIYVPLGYGEAFPLLTSFDKVHGGSPWGAGAYAGSDGSRSANDIELGIAKIQGKQFASLVSKASSSSSTSTSATSAPAATAPAATATDKTAAEPKTTTEAPTLRNKQAAAPEEKSEKSGFCGISCTVM